MKTLRRRWRLLALLLLLAGPGPRPARAQETFGTHESHGEAALIGIFYDLKQTQQRKPTGISLDDYDKIVSDFINKKWDEAVLGPYFRTVRSLYTTQIFIPLFSAGEAPKAFDVQGIVQPRMWLAHYKGQVSPPEDGTYRFVGYGDDICAVAVDEKTVLVAALFNVPGWKAPDSPKISIDRGRHLTAGDWITLKKDQIIDLDVIIGERPGGTFGAFLLYEKQGVTYPQSDTHEPMLPVFQLARHEMPSYDAKLAPSFSVPAVPWTGHQ